MRNPDNAAYDTLNELGLLQTARETVRHDQENPGRWLVTFEALPTSHHHWRLDVEVLEGPVACVMNRFNIGYRPMARIMDKFMDRLEAPRPSRPLVQSPPGGEPAPS